MPPLDPSLLHALRDVVGADGVLVDPERLLVYESDGLTQYRVIPRAVVLPRARSEVARVFRILHQGGIPVVPRGAGTGLSGGALATGGGVIVGTARLNRILEVDPERRRARVEPGVVNAALTRATLPHGLIYAPDPSSQSACTLGGNVAENSGGPHCLKHGVTSRYVRSLEVVLPDGEAVRLGGEETAGELDLAGLFTGSEGCFGMAVEIEVGLIPAPRAVRTLLAIFPSMEGAGEAVTRIMGEGLLPAALEIVDRETIHAVEASVFAAGFPLDAGAALVVEFDGVEAGLDAEMAQAEGACRDAGATELRAASEAGARDALWRGRKKAFGAMGRIAPDLLVQDATVPRSRLPEVLARIAAIGERHGLRVANVFHAGDGNLHPNLLFDRRDPGELARVEAASKEIMEVCIEAGGTITGEHGVGIDKRKYLPLVCPPPVLRVMGEVRRVFDPGGRSNPGKVLPDGWGPPWPPRSFGDAEEGAPPAVEGGVLEHEPADLLLRARGGTTLAEVARVVEGKGQWLPFDPPGDPEVLTLEELVLAGEDGPLALGYGRVRDHLLGLVLRTPGGERLELGGRVVKNVAGFDLVRLSVGSRGRLGRVEEVTFRLFGRPAADRTLLFSTGAGGSGVHGDREAGGLPLSRRLLATGLPVSALEVVAGARRPGVVAVRLLGSERAVEAMARELVEAGEGREGGSGPGALRVLPGQASAAWWASLARELGEGYARVAVGLAHAPALFSALLEEGGKGALSPSPSTLVMGPGGTGLRGAFPGVNLAGGAAETLRALLSARGARLVPGAMAMEPADPVRARLHRGVIRVFGGGSGEREDA